MTAAVPDVIDISERSPLTSVVLPEARPSPRRIVGLVLSLLALVVAGFCLYEFVLSGFMQARSQRTLLSEFRSLTDQGPATTVGWVPAPGQPVAILSIPKLGVSNVVIEGTSSALTAQGPGHFRGSPLPGRPGNSVIFGRRTTYGRPFRNLQTLKPGDQIVFETGVGTFTYVVQSITRVRPGSVDVLNPTTDNRLTLVTSDPPYVASGRLAIVASLQGMPAPQPLQAPPLLTTSEYGLTGDPGALAQFIVWFEVFAVAIFGAVWVSRRISRRVAWLLATPVLLALLFALYGALNQLLPATF
jgi:sortase A